MKKSTKKRPQKRKVTTGSPTPMGGKTRQVWLNVLPDGQWLRVRRGITVWEALSDQDVDLEGECGGLGKCGKCKVKVISSIGRPSRLEKSLLDERELQEGFRLACRTKVSKDLAVYAGKSDPDTEFHQILKSGHKPLFQLDPLVEKKLVAITPDLWGEGLSDLDRIKLVVGRGGHDNLVPSLHCLRDLPEMLEETVQQGTAVLHNNTLLAWQRADAMGDNFGLVFDLGTSTLVGKLINLADGTEVSVSSLLNGQARYGTNVISRLQFVKENPRGLAQLHRVLLDDLNLIIERLARSSGVDPNGIFAAVMAGNTTMQHLAVSLNPAGIAEAPFTPVLTDGLVLKAPEIDLKLHPEARVYFMPTKTGYIGGDVIGVILASQAAEQDDAVVLGLDVGTNGEVFLGNRQRMMTCSTAAGPAMEGATISHGMMAKGGAIESVRLEDDQLKYGVIGNIKPRGICGSGLVDLVAVLAHCGIIQPDGLICRPPRGKLEWLRARVFRKAGVYHFVVATAEEGHDERPIILSQNDVRQLQLAKGAIGAGIQTLMDEMRLSAGDIHHVYLAGALGNYVNPLSAIRIGLIPPVDLKIVESLGNAAATGASMVLLSKYYWQMANELAAFIEHIELSSRIDFNNYFVDQMGFPEANVW